MTDAEKELRRLAEAVRRLGRTRGLVHSGFPEVHDYNNAATPDAVLTLLDRIEALEADSAALVADLLGQDARVEALTTAAQRVVGELRHALKYPDVGGTVDTDIVRRAVVLLEEATTPGRPEKTP